MSHTQKTDNDILTALRKGYIEMSEINLEESNLCVESDNEACQICEKELTECE